MRSIPTLAASIGALAATVAALEPITVQNSDFVDSKGNRFMVLGVDYQPGGQDAYGTGQGDPLSNADACIRDAALMQNLGVNTIRSYNIDPTLDHDECVSIFNAVGIYIIIDVNSPFQGEYISREDPLSTYNTEYLTRVFNVIEAFKSYPNLLGFFAGNEVINDVATASNDNPPVLRAVQRDMKNYIAQNADRAIPVGYSAADVRDLLDDTYAYFQCKIDADDESNSDFFGLNSYSWCDGDSSFTISGYDTLAKLFADTSIPVFFSEYGCNDPQPRLFEEVPVLYGPQMSALSGGLVYEWSQEPSDYGLIQVSDNGDAKILGDYNTLLEEFGKISTDTLTNQQPSTNGGTPPTCGANLISGSGFSTDFDIPQTPSGAVTLIQNGLPNAPSGQIVSVSKTTFDGVVKQNDGSTVEDVHLVTGATAANYPGAATATGESSGGTANDGTSTDGSGGSGSSSDSGAVSVRGMIGSGALLVAGAAFGALAFAL